jgi:diacylglycerol O-acyltransferase / wax synthase
MSIERLSAEDQIMLWPDEIWPQDIGALAILDGGDLFDAAGRFRIEVVKAAIAARLHLLPRFRHLLSVPPPAQGGPHWVDAPAFDLADHVRVLEVPAPGGEAELLGIAEQLVGHRLERARPLWQMWFLTGLPDGRVGWFVKVHHCIADGIAGVATFGTFLDATPDAIAASPEPWTPALAPTAAELLDDNRRRRQGQRRRRLISLAHPARSLRRLAAGWPALRELLAERALPPTSLTRRVGADRSLALVRSRLEVVKEIAHASDARVNDVLLAAIAGGLRGLLLGRGEAVAGTVLRVYVPITLRPLDQRADARGNRVAEMMVPLPIGVTDPPQRLREITAETARRKARTRPDVGKLPHRGIAGLVLLKLIDRQRVNVCTADLPGPQVPLYLAGARVLEVFPMLPLVGKVSLGIGALSYAGQFNITVVADRAAYPDLEVFATGVRDELAALASSAGTQSEGGAGAFVATPAARPSSGA